MLIASVVVGLRVLRLRVALAILADEAVDVCGDVAPVRNAGATVGYLAVPLVEVKGEVHAGGFLLAHAVTVFP